MYWNLHAHTVRWTTNIHVNVSQKTKQAMLVIQCQRKCYNQVCKCNVSISYLRGLVPCLRVEVIASVYYVRYQGIMKTQSKFNHAPVCPYIHWNQTSTCTTTMFCDIVSEFPVLSLPEISNCKWNTGWLRLCSTGRFRQQWRIEGSYA